MAAVSEAIEATQIIRLSVEDQKRFAAAIIDPPSPSNALRRAAAAYQWQLLGPLLD